MFFLFFLVQLVKSRAEIKFTELERKINWHLLETEKWSENIRTKSTWPQKETSVQREKMQKFGLKNWSLFSKSFIVIFLAKTMLQYWKPPEDKQNEIIKWFYCLAEWEKGPLQLVFQVHCDFS